MKKTFRMKEVVRVVRNIVWGASMAVSGGMALAPGLAQAVPVTLEVLQPNGTPIGPFGFRYLVQEDTTHDILPGVQNPHTLSVDFFRSYAPPVMKGTDADYTVTLDLPSDKRYFISVLPNEAYAMGGAPVVFNAGKTGGSAKVFVQPQPIPTAQITVLVYNDHSPINNAPEQPTEAGLAGFTLVVNEVGGRYGQVGGQMLLDAFGNPLGTEYAKDLINDPTGQTFLFNPDGSPQIQALGSGVIQTDALGQATIKYLAPGKYTIEAVPPVGSGWMQTHTIEGGKGIDAWVKANEPPVFVEFGPPGQHVFIGFVQPFANGAALNGTNTISGRVVNLHNSHPPAVPFHAGEPLANCRVGLNAVAGNVGLYAAKCNPDSTFAIPNVPPGSYQLVMWDEYLDNIFASYLVTVNADGSCNANPAIPSCSLGDVPVFRWFGRLESTVFFDRNQNGFRDCVTAECNDINQDDVGMQEQAVNLRHRDGSLYQSFPTDTAGYVPFDEVFPFFKYLIAEVDFLRFKATGATIVVDDGGPVQPKPPLDPALGPVRAYDPFVGKITPQAQVCTEEMVTAGQCATAGAPMVNPNTGNNLSRTVTGPVLLQAMQTFLGTTNIIEWGKAAYGPGENGGITGVVYYASTRAENDPRYGTWDPWEPGIPRVQMNLYQDANLDKVIDDLNGDGAVTRADVDNAPFGWKTGGIKGAEDVDRNANGIFDPGDAVQIATTDSWDDNLPIGCPPNPTTGTFYAHGVRSPECFEGLRTYNQVRDGVFDGGYAFVTWHPGGMASGSPEATLPAGMYIVEATTPPGYETVKEEDKNVDFGDSYVPSPLLLPAECVNNDDTDGNGIPGRLVPTALTLFPGVTTFYGGQDRPVCDRKQVPLHEGQNAASDFFMFTEVPVAANIVGIIVDDTANEFDPNSPSFGEKYAPPWLPISIRDWTGKELARTYSDEWGAFNALAPSSFNANIPMPSGYSPNMLTTCMNSPTMEDPANPGQFITDPFFNRQYSQFCYTFQYMPGVTTYLDTPVLPVAAFAGPGQFPLDCELPDHTPMIHSVTGPAGGPYLAAATGNEILTIVSAGAAVQVPNPAYDGVNGLQPKTVPRDFGFGTVQGTVRIGTTTVPPGNILGWNPDTITVQVPAGTATGSLSVTRGGAGGLSTVAGVTVTVGGAVKSVPVGGSIQAVIDNPLTVAGDTILVPPGNYSELVVLWKNVKLQGWGAASTVINAVKAPAEKIIAWRNKVQGLVDSAVIDLLPGQEVGLPLPEPNLLATEEGPGVIVLAKNGAPGSARIDGFTITGADHGGGIFVNGYADNLQVSNNRIVGNSGVYGGGIRLGHPLLLDNLGGYVNASIDNAQINHNLITQNGALSGAGGGVALYTGAHGYQVTENFVCGNFSGGDAGGIGHMGLSDGGRIANNTILFNQSFQQTANTGGSAGGILVGGDAPPLGAPGGLSPGAGSVTIEANLIQGNLAGAGDGGGILLRAVNGQEVLASPGNPASWYQVGVFDNLIVNNVSGLAGAVTLQDALKVNLVHNTVANNDSTATASAAFTTGPNVSSPQPAGVVGRKHSGNLLTALGALDGYSNPVLLNDIVYHNRSFHWESLPAPGGLLPAPATPVYNDLAVLGTAGSLNPQYSLLTDPTGYAASNVAGPAAGNLLFVADYFNGDRGQVVIPEFTTAIQVAPAFDEGGNFIDVRFGPLTLSGNYHVINNSAAINTADATAQASFPATAQDIDGEARPMGGGVDIGADERNPLSPFDIDTDGDGLADQDDNCTLVANAGQQDSNGDGFGNLCDGDLNNNGITNAADLGVLRQSLGSSIGQPQYNPDADLDSNGIVNAADMGRLKSMLGKPPGPAGALQ